MGAMAATRARPRLPEPRNDGMTDELPLAVAGLDEATMLARLHRRYTEDRGNGPRYVYAEQVRSDVGFLDRDPTGGRVRCLDAMVQCLWTSDGLATSGYEVKCSREDVRRELADPDKAGAFSPYLDYFWLVVADRRLVRDGELPAGWGLLAAAGWASLRVVVPAARNVRAEPIPKGMWASFARSAVRTASR